MTTTLRFAGLSALTLLLACAKAPEKQEAAARFVATTPIVIDTSYERQYVAQIRSIRNIEIRALEKGFLDRMPVDEGRSVSAGQLLFRIMPKVYEAELQKAEAEMRAAEIELENAQSLVRNNVVSKNEQAMAQAKLDQARAEVTAARLHVSFTEIRAPFAGVLDRIPKKLGSLIEEGELLTTLSDNRRMFAYFNVSEPEYLDFRTASGSRTGQKVALLLANNTRFPHLGAVETIEGEFNSETGNIAFRATFPNDDGLLRNGETGKVLLTVPYRGALIIPQKATYEIQDKTYVFVIDAKNHVHARLITVAGRLPDLYVVASGLTATDRILLDGVQKVKEDDAVTVTMKAPRDVLASLRLKAE
ncbi:MAG: efflux RND transporter periplasmic adaptor subunit [Gemmatimonadaceae bacterium]|nr:efflux RND transporter periplasmic adaptor subunit [Gemmatimonadaceae bacterium]